VRSTSESLPRHDRLPLWARTLEVVCLIGASGLLLLHLFRFFITPEFFTWWLPLAIVAGALLADLASGIVHWIADTWGSETMPVLGRRFLHPFRVHHVNPEDFLRRDFIDTNGDIALVTLPYLVAAWFVPLDHGLGRVAFVSLVAFSACALPTNQVHQWAHMSRPPAWVRRLQRWGLLLSPEQHQVHHTAPYAGNYCITTGWCNQTLTAIDFFPALERIITRLTGMKPRSDDQVFAASQGAIGGERSP
jgi:ubiquitin-conjugating enzyme E2 variant